LLLGLLLSLLGAAEAPAKTKACKKGFVRNKAKKCVKKAVAKTTKTTKKASATTAKPSSSASSRPADADPNGVLRIGLDLANSGGQPLKFDPTTMGPGQYIHSLPVLRTLLTRTADGGF